MGATWFIAEHGDQGKRPHHHGAPEVEYAHRHGLGDGAIVSCTLCGARWRLEVTVNGGYLWWGMEPVTPTADRPVQAPGWGNRT